MDILREKIARLVYDDFGPSIDDPWDSILERRKRMGMVSGLSANQERCLDLADAILAIPELKEALENRRYPAAYARTVDGTDSLHPCAKGDPDAIPLYR